MKISFNKIHTAWKLISLLFFTLAAFSYAMFQGGFVSWFLFYSFSPFAIYSLLLLIYPIGQFQVTRIINQEQFTVGQQLIGTITVKRKVPFPLFYLIVEDVISKKLQGSNKIEEPKKLLFPWFKRKVSFSYSIQNIPRGEHHFTKIRIKTGDLFGLIEKEVYVDVKHYFLVYPSYVDLVYSPTRREFEQGSTSSLATYWQDSTMAVGVREYQPGDKLSSIDWKATARRDSIMTKEFEQMQSHDVMIILDRERSALFETMVTYTASLLRTMMKSGARVGLVSVGRYKQVFPLQSDEEHLRHLFYHLALVECDSHTGLATILKSDIGKTEMKHVTHMIVTSYLTIDLVRKLENLSGRNQMYKLFVVKYEKQLLTKEENVLIDRLKKLHIDVKLVNDLEGPKGIREVSRS
ncbi:DUF58 domain-containing protein [Metabacillus sediminilitoris]|uniref:DUF58 domain-containing protein n=1 Tax=Metabacillus sediminilitoris TaxID=2567941 RepID=A0A4S4BLD4_9BACI|nr:DUF58 domain-containing protein [Metabacillus sediminilitoris]QGQ44124.1 DUF58 domain-containing protein [Metabacillus sediminilitoris]THF75569.1 DUF58 domain-containing protein [Metabacillus sediminilitoris]